MPRTPGRITFAAAALVTLGACSGSSHSSSSTASTTTTPASTTTAAAAGTSTTLAAAPTTAPKDPAIDAKLKSGLLAVSDVGGGFASAPYTANDPSKPAPCGGQSTKAKYPAAAAEGAEFVMGSSFALSEELVGYPDAATADAAYAYGVSSVTCSTGTLFASDGTSLQVTLSAPTDVSASVGVPKATEIGVTSPAFKGDLILAEVGTDVAAFSFQADPNADTATVPAPTTVAKAGVAKLAAA